MPNSDAPFDWARQLSPRLLIAILLGLSVLLYINTLGYGLVLDDNAVFNRHRYVGAGFAGIPDILRTPYWWGYTDSINSLYRPLPLVVLAVLRGLFGESPVAPHLLNVLLYPACVLLLYRFLIRLFGPEQRLTAFLAALLFAVHPVHTEVVASIKSCDEMFSFAFSMLALTSLLGYLERGRWPQLLALAGFSFLALVSKESAVCISLIVALIAWRYRKPKPVQAIAAVGAVLTMIGVFLLIRHNVLMAYEGKPFHVTVAENSLAAADTASARLANSLMLVGQYLKLLVIPDPLISDYSYNTLPLVDWSAPQVALSLIAYALTFGFAVYRLATRRNDRLAFGILFYGIGIALFANLVFLIGATFALRFLFLPSAGFCIAIAALLVRDTAPKDGVAGLRSVAGTWAMLAAVVVFTGLTLQRNPDFKDDETLFSADIPKAPENYRMPYYLATRYLVASGTETDPVTKKNYLMMAIPLLRHSISIFEPFTFTNAQLGNVYMNLGYADSGLLYSRRGLELNPKDTFTLNNIASYYFRKGDYREAARLSWENVAINSYNFQAYSNLGACYLRMGVPDSAVLVLRKAWEIHPNSPRAGYMLYVAFDMNGNTDSAKRYVRFKIPEK